ncbi:Gp49 family protein [Cupriavidus necator]|uniref:Gp49 family protein n=1 Tax=Cupriavidus necator TaxID=106590 RepID=UPI003ECDB232
MTRITPADIEAAIASEFYFTAGDTIAPPVSKMVDRFLGWKLPQDFYPDCFVGFDRDAAQANQSWPSGTNLLHAGQAKEMFEHAIGKPEVPQSLGMLTFCVLVLRNGHRVVGINYGPVDPALFSAEMAREQAREDAIRQVWPLLGYELRTKLAAPVEGVLGDVRIVPAAGAMPTSSPVAEAAQTRCQADQTWCESARTSTIMAATSAQSAVGNAREAAASARDAIGSVLAAKQWKPRIGDQVMVKGYIANGTDEHAGLITRVHGAGEGAFANVTAFPDLQSPKIFSSIPVYSSRAAADADIPGATRRRDGFAYLLDKE